MFNKIFLLEALLHQAVIINCQSSAVVQTFTVFCVLNHHINNVWGL